MAKAKIIPDAALNKLLDEVAGTSRLPERDFVIILLSCKAGLRACEIAGLSWADVTDVSGGLSHTIVVPSGIAKKGHARVVPMHPVIHEALTLYREVYGRIIRAGNYVELDIKARGRNRIILGSDASEMSANNLQKFMGRLYRRHGLEASSHSGRRSVITKLARMANDHGCSLFDVQAIAGHANIATTEAYVELSDNAAKMMEAL